MACKYYFMAILGQHISAPKQRRFRISSLGTLGYPVLITCGFGSPATWQANLTSWPSLVNTSLSCERNDGGVCVTSRLSFFSVQMRKYWSGSNQLLTCCFRDSQIPIGLTQGSPGSSSNGLTCQNLAYRSIYCIQYP